MSTTDLPSGHFPEQSTTEEPRNLHWEICAVQKGILTHAHRDNYGRWEDPHPWPCEKEMSHD